MGLARDIIGSMIDTASDAIKKVRQRLREEFGKDESDE